MIYPCSVHFVFEVKAIESFTFGLKRFHQCAFACFYAVHCTRIRRQIISYIYMVGLGKVPKENIIAMICGLFDAQKNSLLFLFLFIKIY